MTQAALPGDPIPSDVGTVVLVEGPSDVGAVTVAARSLGRSLDDVAVVSMRGITNVARYVAVARAGGHALRGLYDVGEESFVGRALGVAGRDAIVAAGFFACVPDLEDELIRALGVDRVERFVLESDEASTWAVFGKQPAQRGRDLHARLHRFAGIRSGRKTRYGAALTELCGPDLLPDPLRRLVTSL